MDYKKELKKKSVQTMSGESSSGWPQILRS